jgi:hypothetical protein
VKAFLRSFPPAWRAWSVAASLLGSAGCAAASTSAFSPTLPAALPSLVGWEKHAARGIIENPSRIVDYEFFVRPGREATYEVIRYLIHPAGRSGGDPSAGEKLQWDLDGRNLRRFELVTDAGGSHWEEFSKASDSYTRETRVILDLLSLHRRRLGLSDAFSP